MYLSQTKRKKVKQIRYFAWGSTPTSKATHLHKDYFQNIDCIANFIAMQLEAFSSTVDKEESYTIGKASSIIVSSYKEKYGEVRVYCQLAVRELLEKQWEMGSNTDFDNFDEFVRSSYVRDAMLYRRSYLNAVRMWPQYEEAILDCADYSEFLCKTKKEFERKCQTTNPEWEKEKALVQEVCWPWMPKPAESAQKSFGPITSGCLR